MRWKRAVALLITGLWIWFIFARSAKTAGESSAESATISAFLIQMFPWLTVHAVRKLAHFTEYFILGILLFTDWRMLRRGFVFLPLGFGAVVACVDEFLIQRNTLGRSGELRDVLLDSFGVAAAVGIFLLLNRRKGSAADERK